MASVAARTGVWEWGTNVCQKKKRTKLVGRDHFKFLRGYCKQWRKKGKNGTIKQYLAASFAKQTYFHKVLPITATSFNRLYLSESKKPFLIVREKATLLRTHRNSSSEPYFNQTLLSVHSQRQEFLPPGCKNL